MGAKTRKKILWLSLAAVAAIALGIWLAWGNWAVTVSEYTVTQAQLPEAFDGFRIVQVSDLHNTEFGENNSRLLEKIRTARPDMIAVTGDLIDSYHTDLDVAADFIREAVKIAPVYYVTGNHEHRIADYVLLKVQMEAAGVTVMENETCVLQREGQSIRILGVQDPTFLPGWTREKEVEALENAVKQLQPREGYTIMLNHRPNYPDVFAAHGIDLALGGHLHGGQFRVPFMGGLYSPTLGFFPDYDAGVWTVGDTVQVVSRGLGNSAFPLRINNPPELVVVQLKSA